MLHNIKGSGLGIYIFGVIFLQVMSILVGVPKTCVTEQMPMVRLSRVTIPTSCTVMSMIIGFVCITGSCVAKFVLT